MFFAIFVINIKVMIAIDEYFINLYGDYDDMSEFMPNNQNSLGGEQANVILQIGQNNTFVYQFEINKATVFPLEYYSDDFAIHKLVVSISQQQMVNYTSRYQLQDVADQLIVNCKNNSVTLSLYGEDACKAQIQILRTHNVKKYDLWFNQTNFYYKALNASKISIDFIQDQDKNGYNLTVQINFSGQNPIHRLFPDDTPTIQVGQMQFRNYNVLNSLMLQDLTNGVFYGVFTCDDLINNVRMCDQAMYSLYSSLQKSNQTRVRIFSNKYNSEIFTDYQNNQTSVIITGYVGKVNSGSTQNTAVGILTLVLAIIAILGILGLSIYFIIDYQNPKSKTNCLCYIEGWSHPEDMVASCKIAEMVASKLNPYLDTEARLNKLSHNVVYKSSLRYQDELQQESKITNSRNQNMRRNERCSIDSQNSNLSTINMLTSDISNLSYKGSKLSMKGSRLKNSQRLKTEEELEEKQNLLSLKDLE